MSTTVLAPIVLCVLGIVFGLILGFASKVFAVEKDPREEAITEILPGANCGGCGYAGCDGYANALASGEEDKCNKCTAGGNSVALALSEACGMTFEETEKKVAFVHCKGTCDVTNKKAEFYGDRSCSAAKLLFGGDGACQFGCLGYGDCAAVCPEQAINVINGVAHVNPDRCMGCGLCEKTCPNHVISIVPAASTVHIACSNKDKGAVARKKCTAGCLGCGLCMRKCEQGAISIVNNVAVIDYEKCVNCGTCASVCPSKCII